MRSTLYAGRVAGRGISAVVHGLTSQSSPASSTIRRANSNHEHDPAAARWTIPRGGRLPTASSTIAVPRCSVNVGQPIWSATTWSSSRSEASRRIVAGKHGPPPPNSHEERTIVWASGLFRATSRSPSSFERPYADSGLVGSDSRYGSRLVPSNT